MAKVFGVIEDLVRPHNRLESGWYWVKQSNSSEWEIAYLMKGKKWWFAGTLQSYTPFEVGLKIDKPEQYND